MYCSISLLCLFRGFFVFVFVCLFVCFLLLLFFVFVFFVAQINILLTCGKSIVFYFLIEIASYEQFLCGHCFV